MARCACPALGAPLSPRDDEDEVSSSEVSMLVFGESIRLITSEYTTMIMHQ